MAALERAAFSEPWSEQGFASALSQGQNIFLVAADSRELTCGDCAAEEKNPANHPGYSVIGYCGLYVFADEGEVTNVAVAEVYRCQGVGAALIEAVKAAAWRKGVRRFFLEVRETNTPAQKLYLKSGFEYCGKRKRFYRKPTEDALLMVCRLREMSDEEKSGDIL
ncbi:MAG: ribosomal protein S18-alanine N-acetyltransferase [Clostridiales bacterium]|nr:ribosomal protein S18-alanine N-acetyltransferase [Clostridiales bacterium]